MKRVLFLICCLCTLSSFGQSRMIRSGEIWPDDRGQHINAHGGGILQYQDTYYWFGEHKSERTSDALVGVTCYASDDLVHWRYCGVALSVVDERGHDIERGCVLERPKVIYNKVTGKFCMWFHLELKGHGYDAARYGVAVADRPEGPYKYLYSQRADAGTWPVEFDQQALAVVDTLNEAHFQEWWTPAWHKAVDQGLIVKRDFGTGQMSRDMTLYVDDDGKAYHIFSSEENLTLHIAELTGDYLHHTGRYTRVAPAGHNEAPAIFKHEGTYWMITSGCTGWAPNEARMFSAPSIWGPWTQHPNPCRGPKAELTFGGQSTFILPLNDKLSTLHSKHIFMADIWRPFHPIDARYIWLPIEFEDGKPVIQWRDEWEMTPEDVDGKYATALLKPGKKAPDFKMKTPDGELLQFSKLAKGKTVVLDFWASWCPDCRKDAPKVVRMYEKFHPKGIEFIGISMDTDVEAWKKAIARYGITYPQLSELKKFKETAISKTYGVQWIPSMVVVGPDGKVKLSTVMSYKVEDYLNSITSSQEP